MPMIIETVFSCGCSRDPFTMARLKRCDEHVDVAPPEAQAAPPIPVDEPPPIPRDCDEPPIPGVSP